VIDRNSIMSPMWPPWPIIDGDLRDYRNCPHDFRRKVLVGIAAACSPPFHKSVHVSPPGADRHHSSFLPQTFALRTVSVQAAVSALLCRYEEEGRSSPTPPSTSVMSMPGRWSTRPQAAANREHMIADPISAVLHHRARQLTSIYRSSAPSPRTPLRIGSQRSCYSAPTCCSKKAISGISMRSTQPFRSSRYTGKRSCWSTTEKTIPDRVANSAVNSEARVINLWTSKGWWFSRWCSQFLEEMVTITALSQPKWLR
jgi:hypothetical protein